MLTITNPLNVPITVDSLTVKLTSSMPVGCPAGDMKVNNVSFSGTPPQVVLTPALTVAANSSAPVTPTTTLALTDNHNDQVACKKLALLFDYAGSAHYTASTSTALTSAPNPSIFGQTVTFTATVTHTTQATSSPTGTVNFYSCPTTACASTTSLGSATVQPNGQALFPTSSLPIGTTVVRSTYTGDASFNFSASSSNTVSQVVYSGNTTSALTSSLNPSTFGQPVTFTDTVTAQLGTPSGSVTFYDGATPLTNATLSGGKATFTTSSLAGGNHTITATYAGNAPYLGSTSNPVTQPVGYTQTISGNTGGLTVGNGQSVLFTGKANGNVTVRPGGALTVSGGTINGALTSSGAKAITVCRSSVAGGVSVSGTTGFVLIGDAGDDGSPTCAGNTITGGASLTNNTGGVELGGNAKISGGVTFNNNTGAGPAVEDAVPEIEANSITGGLTCSANPVTDDHKPNTVTGTRSGPCVGSF